MKRLSWGAALLILLSSTALAQNGNSSAGSGGGGSTVVSGTANEITVTGAPGGPYTISVPNAFVPPGTIDGLTITTTTGSLTIANGTTLTDTSGVGADLLLGSAGGGFAAYGGTSSAGHILLSLNAAGAGTFLPYGTSGTNTLVETSGAGFIASSIIPTATSGAVGGIEIGTITSGDFCTGLTSPEIQCTTGSTGSGSVVLATSPTLTTPALGTPSAVVLTNATGLSLGGIVNITNQTVLGNGSGSPAAPAALALGANLVATSSTLNMAFPVETANTLGLTFAATDMGKLIPMNGSSITATISATGFGATIFAAGQTVCIEDIAASAVTVTNSSGATMYPTVASITTGTTLCLTSDGTNLYAQIGPPSVLTAANPSGTAGPAAVNGSATTFMRSDAAPAVQKGSASQFGIVEADGTTITAAAGVLTAVGGSSVAAAPQGRLTLQTGVAVQNTDEVGVSTIYYDTDVGNLVPVGGASMVNLTITSDEVSMGLSTSNHLSGNLYDIFAVNNSSALALCTGPAWSSTSARSTAIALKSGVWTNGAAMTHCFGGAAGATDYGTVAQYAGTLLGTMYATANGQTGNAFAPSGAAGGTNNIVGVVNIYNTVTKVSVETDSSATWAGTGLSTAGPSDVGATGSGLNNRVTWVDPLGQSGAEGQFAELIEASVGTTFNAAIGGGCNTTTTPVKSYNFVGNALVSTNIFVSITAPFVCNPSLGLRFAQATEDSTVTSLTFFGGSGFALDSRVKF